MSYTFDRTAVLVRPAHERDDDEQWVTVTQPAILGVLDFTDTQPATMDADQLRRDLIASQCQVSPRRFDAADAAMAAWVVRPVLPHIPRKRSPILSADSPDGTSRQGRDIPSPTEPVEVISDDLAFIWFRRVVTIAIVAIACAFALAGCGGGGDDCHDDSATVQPVECAASGCAK